MINTLLEHVPIKMEVKDVEEDNVVPPKNGEDHEMVNDDEDIDETDEEEDSEEDEDFEEEDEESDIEPDALEIEKEATMLISSDEEAELEAQRIRFPDVVITKKIRKDSTRSSRSSSSNSLSSNSSSKPHITYEIVQQKDCTEETVNKQSISPRLKKMENNKTLESSNKENNNIKILLKQKKENKKLENNKNNKQEDSNRLLGNQKTTTDIQKNSDNNYIENLLKSPSGQKSRRESNNSTCSVASTVGSEAETESCGNIYVLNLEQKLIFNCEFCDLKYGNLENFSLHLREAHKLFSSDEDHEKENAPRNLRTSNRLPINAPKNSTNIKKEPLQCVEILAGPSIALPPAILAEPLESCGNVFMINHRKLFLVCGYCESKYANLELFEKHLRQQHRIFEGCRNEVNVVPKVEIKEEVFIITEVAEKPSIGDPQAMVTIPAEIPLDISITPQNEHATVTVLEEIAVNEETVTLEKVTLEETIAQGEVALEDKATAEEKVSVEKAIVEPIAIVEKTAVLEETVAVEKIDTVEEAVATNTTTVEEEIMVTIPEINKEILSKSPVLPTITEKCALTEDQATSNDVGVAGSVAENEKSKIENKEMSSPKKTRSKRETSIDQQLDPPKKRPKRLTRNNTRMEQELTSINEIDKVREKSSEDVRIMKTDSVADLSKTKETNGVHKSKKLPEPLTKTTPENTKIDEINETSQSQESKNIVPLKLAETNETKVLPSSDEIKSLNLIKNKAKKKSPEPEKTKAPELNETRKKRKLPVSEETSSKLIETRLTRTSPESEKTKAPELNETREKRKLQVFEEKSPKHSEARKTKKLPESEKPTNLKLDGTGKARKLSESEETKSLQLTETRDIIKLSETEKPTQLKLNESTEIRISADFEKTKSSKLNETGETKKSPESEKTECLKRIESRETRKSTKHSSTIIPPNRETREKRKVTKAGESKKQTPKPLKGTKEKTKSAKSSETKKLKQEKCETEDSKFQCSKKCRQEFANKQDLQNHECTLTGESDDSNKKYKCEVCDKKFHNRNDRREHMLARHKLDKPWVCGMCLRRFKSLVGLTFHKQKVHAAKLFKCGICLRAYRLKKSLKAHIAKDHDPSEKVAMTKRKSTPKTELSTITEETLPQPHLSEVTENPTETTKETALHQEINVLNDLTADPVDDIIEQLQNEVLDNTPESTSVHTVTYTINAVPTAEEAKKSSRNTPIVFDAQLNVIDNTEDVKPTFMQIVKHFVCDVCSKIFTKQSRLVEHNRLHTGEKPFACDICGKQFRVRMRLNEHKLRHSKDKKFKCELCQLPLCTKQDLNLHMRHHTNDRRYQCNVCPKAFVRSSDLKIHVRVHTGEKPYMCDICHKCFRANQNLSVHRKSHLGEASKTFQCEHCNKKFMRKIDRKVHMRSHTGEKPYKCEICQRGYSSKVNVRAHIERDHILANDEDSPPKTKKKPGPKPRGLRKELEKQKKLIEELQNQLLQQIKTDEKIILSDEEMAPEHTLQHSTLTVSSANGTTTKIDPIQSAYELLNKLKASSTATSKPLTVIPSPPPLAEPLSNPFTKAKKDSTTLLPLTITQTLEQASLAPSSSQSTSTACLTASSPPKNAAATKVVSQKTSLGIQQVSVTVSMQVENVSASPNALERENAGNVTSSSSSTTSVKKERKITSYFTVLGQKSEG